MKTFSSKKESVSGAIRNTFDTNQFDVLAGHSNGFSDSDFTEVLPVLQSNLLARVNPTPKIIRLFHCFSCEKDFAIRKMSNCLVICRNCYVEAQGKGKTAKNNFLAKTANKVHGYLRRRI